MAGEDNIIPINIPDFYRGRSILLTGFTGSLGKLLVEKLLYSCPEINKIYVIVRPKRGQNPKERVKEVIKSMAFKRVLEKSPDILDTKIIPLSGDMLEDKLGLSHEDEEIVRKEVSVIIHGAASVRFDDPLDLAVKQNLLGVKKMVDLALTMPKLASLVYISTAYTNCDHTFIKEEIYPPKVDWRVLVKLIEKIDSSTLQLLTRKYMDTMPNTYVFTKSLSEQVINEYRDRLPVVIVRPSIVVPAFKEPIPGWTDNKYGPLALIIGFVLGIVRCSWVDVAQKCNYVPSDVVINSIIVASWKTAISCNPKIIPDSVTVYHSCTPYKWNMDHEEFSLIYNKGFTRHYLKKENIYLVCLMFVKNKLWYRINILYRHLLPAAIIDLILIISKRKPILVSVRRKVFIATEALSYFTMRTFFFEDEKFNNLMKDLNPEDKKVFGWDFNHINLTDLYHSSSELSRFTLLKPLYDDFLINRKRLHMLYMVDRGAVYLVHILVALLIYTFSIPQVIYSFITGLVYF